MAENPEFQVKPDIEINGDESPDESKISSSESSNKQKSRHNSKNNSSILEEESTADNTNTSDSPPIPRIKETIQNKIIKPNSPLYSSTRKSRNFSSESGRSSNASECSSSSRNSVRKQNAMTSPPPKSSEDSSTKEDKVVAYKQLIENRKKPPITLAAPVQQMLHRSFVNALKNEDYVEGMRISTALKINSELMEQEYESQRIQSRNDTYKSRLEAAQNRLNAKKSEWNNIIQSFEQKQKQKREKLTQKHEKEEEEFEKQWGDANNLKDFNKPSPSLIGIRRIQKELAMTGEFEDALQVKQIADGLKEKEIQDAEQRALVAMLIAHDKLEEKHKKEILCFEEKQRQTELYIKGEQYNELHPLEMLIKQLQQHLDSSKPPNLRPTKPRFVSTARTRSAACESFTMPPKDTKTTIEMNEYRFNNEPERLELNGFDVRNLMRMPKSTMKACIRRK
ncbi:hypothetical protein TVAG_071560 [Trichomonas vaginalis G3]|uniref:Uncharacterized protein n=1 Tax=Trichomonas vaginalis (strain ATCC PRA-98 / G3) TaxID=412133 RepID=A2D859_TRIV3|nr:hypothetical protein TVAGG3_1046650 [Trichomonas vaginalis G3]EAY23492.1 hypothetical protein TVAG_071560 [Trichomonas vaginalis G3]KAI5493914.1 hypothetical protein TVAGG3_1046650 [Trichomonas vaginalis G3]|eukprot:XP_001584478.1 hypothetical protein [Trichomonas vaginalis G3]